MIVGYLEFSPVDYKDFHDYTDNDVQLGQLYIDPSFYSRGIGTALMDALLSDERIASNDRIFLDVWPENVKANGLYLKYGFRKVGELPFYIDGKYTGSDDIMVKDLR